MSGKSRPLVGFKTPAIPNWIRDIHLEGYRNVFSYALDNVNLWGTETLFGDWDGRYLLVAKDFYPTAYIQAGILDRIRNPYRHKDGIPTNTGLLKTLRHHGKIGKTHSNANCDFMYISACFLLRDDGKIRGALPNGARALELSAPVVEFTLDGMPHLRQVILMGDDAARAFRSTGLDTVFQRRSIATFRVSHPAYAMSDARRFAEWEPVFAQ